MKILAFDPGSRESAWVGMHDGMIVGGDIVPNERLVEGLFESALRWWYHPDLVAIEWITNYGKIVGASTFETCFWAGRLFQSHDDRGNVVQRISRRDVKRAILGTVKGNDAAVRAALLARFGGKDALKGQLKGFKSHMWSALAVAVTVQDRARITEGTCSTS